MELFFYSLQSILAVLGALLVLFARTTQKAFWGFALTLFALLPVVLQNKGPVELLIFGIAAVLICSSFIYLNKSKVFEKRARRPLDTQLGLSRLLAILTTFYFLGSFLPFWPSGLSQADNSSIPIEKNMAIWIGGFFVFFILCSLGMIPFYRERTPKS